jgi:hypothetical protein
MSDTPTTPRQFAASGWPLLSEEERARLLAVVVDAVERKGDVMSAKFLLKQDADARRPVRAVKPKLEAVPSVEAEPAGILDELDAIRKRNGGS